MRESSPVWISVLIKESLESLLPLPPCGDTGVYEPGSQSSPDTESADVLILNFSASRTIKRYISIVYKPLGLWHSVVAA